MYVSIWLIGRDLAVYFVYVRVNLAQIRSMAANDKNEDIMNNPNYLMQIAIKSSDLGHCAKIKHIHLKWYAFYYIIIFF